MRRLIHDEGDLIRCINELTISQDGVTETISGIKSEKFKLNSDVLCNNWGIGTKIAENTIKAKESDVLETLELFLGRYGIHEALISDGAKSYTGGEYSKKAKHAGIFCKLTAKQSTYSSVQHV
jgi:hypothetical protein